MNSGRMGERTNKRENGLPKGEVMFRLTIAMDETINSGSVRINSYTPDVIPRMKESNWVLMVLVV